MAVSAECDGGHPGDVRPDVKSIEAFLLEDCGGRFQDKSWLFGLFGSVVYAPTGETVLTGFRYYACEASRLKAAVEALDLKTLETMPFAVDDEGEPDTSGVVVDLHYTATGSMVAIQLSEYQDHRPVPLTSPVLLEREAAAQLLPQVRSLDQST